MGSLIWVFLGRALKVTKSFTLFVRLPDLEQVAFDRRRAGFCGMPAFFECIILKRPSCTRLFAGSKG